MWNKRQIFKLLSNLPGYRTSRKIVVFESDDWGSERFPDRKTLDEFITDGHPVKNCGFSFNDCLETDEDLQALQYSLQKAGENIGKTPRLTLLTNVANPDFEKISQNDFREYHSRLVSETYALSSERKQVPLVFQELEDAGLVDLQYHGREHLYVARWLRDLREGKEASLYGFHKKVAGISPSYMPGLPYGYRAAYDLDLLEDLKEHKQRIEQGVEDFYRVYGKRPNYFVAPDGPLALQLEDVLKEKGIEYIGFPKVQKVPLGGGKSKSRYHWLGKRTRHGQTVITRNVIFEPMGRGRVGNVEAALNDIELAFRMNKPAIISSHRANYTGGIHRGNRENGLEKLEQLFAEICRKWPEVEFLSSSELGRLMREGRKVPA